MICRKPVLDKYEVRNIERQNCQHPGSALVGSRPHFTLLLSLLLHCDPDQVLSSGKSGRYRPLLFGAWSVALEVANFGLQVLYLEVMAQAAISSACRQTVRQGRRLDGLIDGSRTVIMTAAGSVWRSVATACRSMVCQHSADTISTRLSTSSRHGSGRVRQEWAPGRS
jgi:hypothetical protein